MQDEGLARTHWNFKSNDIRKNKNAFKGQFLKRTYKWAQSKIQKDPALLERTIYAFGMLEAITQVNLPFIFKGETCLMLLLNNPARLSTDIDIIVKPGIDISEYEEAASKIFPFTDYEE